MTGFLNSNIASYSIREAKVSCRGMELVTAEAARAMSLEKKRTKTRSDGKLQPEVI